MILEVDLGWYIFEDFLEVMISKYWVWVWWVFCKGDSLGCWLLILVDLDCYKVCMYEFYSVVVDWVDFSLICLQLGYFLRFKRVFGVFFKVIGYFDEEELVGFCLVLCSGVVVEVYFLGFDEVYNEFVQLYFNMLLVCIWIGIEDFGSWQIIFGCIVIVIKSLVGGYLQF